MLRAGAASRDITPALGGDFFGYVRPDIRARGVALRLSAHALVLDDGQRKVGLLTLDLGAPLVTREVLAAVADLGFDLSNLLVAATHTHAGPSRPDAFMARQAADALRAADAASRPAVAEWSRARLEDANHNRSLEAHLANHGLDLYPGTGAPALDPEGDEHPRDLALRLLRVDGVDGAPIAAWAHFSVHPTTFSPANVLLSADFPGAATRHFRRELAASGVAPPVAIFTNGTEGDLIPVYDECNQHACADRMGLRTAAAMRVAWERAGGVLRDDLPLAGAVRRVVYEGQEVEPGRRVARKAWFGLPFVGGAANGPHLLYGYVEGRRRPRALAGAVHGRKLLVMPAPWSPAADVTVLRIGETLLLGVPGEPTVEAGRRMCAAALAAASDASPDAVSDALVVGLAQGYRGYFTTSEEYEQQHYEGGHTVFGKHTSLLVQHAHATLATQLVTTPGPTPTAPPFPLTVNGSGDISPELHTLTVGGEAARPARMVEQPPAEAARFATVSFSWRTAPLGHDRPVGAPYLVLQRLGEHGQVETVDDDLGTGFVWRQRRDTATAYYELPPDLPIGTYRFAVGAPSVAVATRPFAVTASRDLRLLGVHAEHGRLVFRAQNPPPDPLAALRARARSPRGGTLRFLTAGREHEAAWDGHAAAWVADVEDGPTEVVVPACGLRDESGNSSGGAVTLTVGEARPLHWPPPMGPGGGRCPGPFGLGPAGKPAFWSTAGHAH